MSKAEEEEISQLISKSIDKLMIVEVTFQLPYDEAIEVINFVKKFKSERENKDI